MAQNAVEEIKMGNQTLKAAPGTPEQFDSDDLICIVQKLGAMRYLLQDMQEEYFEQYAPGTPDRNAGIVWEFQRNAARAMAVESLLHSVLDELRELHIEIPD